MCYVEFVWLYIVYVLKELNLVCRFVDRPSITVRINGDPMLIRQMLYECVSA